MTKVAREPVFGDLVYCLDANTVSRGGKRFSVLAETVEMVDALSRADGLALSGPSLWRAVEGPTRPFDGIELAQMIEAANAQLMDVDCEIEIRAFTCRLVDVTPRVFLGLSSAPRTAPQPAAPAAAPLGTRKTWRAS